MTAVATQAGASSHAEIDWHAINWLAIHRNVRRLQVRIVKALREDRWGKVKALQHLLTHSFSGRALAVKRVTENQGKMTPGVDGETWNTPKKKAQAVQELKQKGYQAQPLRRVYIPKSNHPNKKRALGIPTMLDRGMQALYLLALDPVAETTGDQNSYGFRTERSTADAVDQSFKILRSQHAPQWILDCDIKSCFDQISHDWLVKHTPMDKTMLQKWLKAGFMEKHVLYPTDAGTPQGGIASPVLANLALDGLEKMLQEHYPKTSKAGQLAKINMVRYADDIIVTGSTKELLENEVQPLVEQFLKERGLKLSSEKTKITHIEGGFDFLGQNIRKYNGKLIIKPSPKSVKAFLKKIREVIKGNKQATAGNLILKLNPIIRGWANYHQHVVSKKTFNKVDHAIFKTLWSWAKRRHGNKSSDWIKNKYFPTGQGRNWVFFGKVIGNQGQIIQLRLIQAVDTPIKRHRKIKGAANPYDPQWEIYFEERLGVKMASRLKEKRKLLYLWKEQNGLCPICQQKITKLTQWHDHHIIQRTLGGTHKMENRVLLHPNCHRKVHSQGIKVAKPRPARGV